MQSAPTLLTVPKEYLKPEGGLNTNVAMFLTALALIATSVCGYAFWDWPGWCCFTANVLDHYLVDLPMINALGLFFCPNDKNNKK